MRAFLLLFLLQAPGLPAQTLWQIGTFNESPVEFTSKPPARIEYEIGKSRPDRDWPARQRTGQTNSVLFQLDSPEGSYTLKIAALIDRPRVPALEVNVNGHKGTFFLHPELSYSRSDFSYAFDPHESQSALEIDRRRKCRRPARAVNFDNHAPREEQNGFLH